MPNAKDAELSSTESVLALGEIGNGKTSQFLTLPGRKFMYCFDPGALRAIQGYDIEYEEFVADAMDLDISVHSLAKSVTPDRSRVRKKIEPVTYINGKRTSKPASATVTSRIFNGLALIQ
jgi:hypothetical protein